MDQNETFENYEKYDMLKCFHGYNEKVSWVSELYFVK